tara:strand:- start:1061 stop:2182 length:1122 start_codon:yes stop_codon:yes gene_type:complete
MDLFELTEKIMQEDYAIKTQGIKYAGSKREIIPKILQLIPSDVVSVLDACSGSTRVSQSLRKSGYKTTSNDLADYSRVFSECFLLNEKEESYYQDWIDHLNSVSGVEGWFTKNYGGVVSNNPKGNAIQDDGLRRPFQKHNMMKLDSILLEIPNLTTDPIEKSVLLTSVLLAVDKVDNTIGHFVAYLKDWPKRSYEYIRLEVPNLIPKGNVCKVSQKSVFDIEEEYDLVYLDPPYGTNSEHKTTRVRYKSYYHIWTTICKNDQPTLHGASLRRYDSSSDTIKGSLSLFEETDSRLVYKETVRLIEKLKCKYIMFSYSNKSILSKSDLESIFGRYKILAFDEFQHKENAMKHTTINNQWLGDQGENKEFLILVQK